MPHSSSTPAAVRRLQIGHLTTTPPLHHHPSTELHVYDKDKNYKPFDADKPEPFFELQRKVIPSTP
jgi:hypothetical protein